MEQIILATLAVIIIALFYYAIGTVWLGFHGWRKITWNDRTKWPFFFRSWRRIGPLNGINTGPINDVMPPRVEVPTFTKAMRFELQQRRIRLYSQDKGPPYQEYLCDECGGVFEQYPEDPVEAKVEVARNFPGLPIEDMALVCDDCYNEIMWRVRNDR